MTFRLTAVTITLALTSIAVGKTAVWEENFADAVKRANAEDKDLLLEFTGSDWCPACIRLEKEVFASKEFGAGIPEKFVLVKLDYPQGKKQPAALAEQNDDLLNRFQIEAFPTVLLLDKDQRPYGSTGYAGDGANAFLEEIADLRSARTKRDQKFTLSESAEGEAKAKALADGLAALSDDLVGRFYTEELDALKKLDPKDTLGVAKKHGFKRDFAQLQKELQDVAAIGEDAAYLALVDDFIREHKLKGEQKQLALMEKMLLYGTPDTLAKAEEALKGVVAVDKKTATARRAGEILARIKDIRLKLENREP